MNIKEHSTVEMEDGPFTIEVHETDGELKGFTVTYVTASGKQVWFEMLRADATALQGLLSEALKEADAIKEDAE